jgi:hypothetical protein
MWDPCPARAAGRPSSTLPAPQNHLPYRIRFKASWLSESAVVITRELA